MSCEDSVLLQWNALENKEEHRYPFEGRISSLQVDDEKNMHVVTLKGEYKIYNIETHQKVGEIKSHEREYHWITLN